ncbi:ABC transporter related protein [Planococcus donghaensis MPA1U2]|uniref:Autoinducer 2 import ATP-binding protein LsrA n=1 Tax=Planococcus donghaensis MPA1U2 TaxID=933115 RepID=E7RCE0_9BACL|nr:sugar ABC transporter ATP-binding protein [Planococcus donghaensis]EGA91305.1 ABC transporter related protein [Planococcus donghaensis MPA1U2]
MAEPLLSMSAIGKKFGTVTALQNAEFHLKKGEVHAILGVNGAGKSTLIKILSGVYQQDNGTIYLDGSLVQLATPKSAKEKGIYCVYQEVDTAIVSDLTVAENILLDTFANKGKLFISRQKLNDKARMILHELQVEHINVQQKAMHLTLAEKQMVLIARALVHSAKIIIFDEPTAPLSIHESEKLYAVISKLKRKGVGCVFISHRLPEVFEISDRITVMREGAWVETYATVAADQSQVIEAMLGEALSHELEPSTHFQGAPFLQVENLSDGDKLKNLSLTVSSGEVVGVVGLVGAGKTELAKALFGATPLTSGTIKLEGKVTKIKHPADAIKAGMALIPEERRKEGLFVQESLEINATFPNLKKFSKGLFINRKAEKRYANEIIERLRVKTSSTDTALLHLSGGNQQKVAIGKWISLDSALYLFDEPTKGVDIGAKVDIFKLIRQLTEKGKGCLYFSSEIHEAIGISDRILIMHNGQIVKELSRQEATQERILLYASGGKEQF